jgi:tungstate transport system ATP-binding protein
MSAWDHPSTRLVYELRGLAKEYGGRRVLDIEALDIYAGEVMALVGPSGSGKSTLLRLLNFLEFPTGGTITFEGTKYQAGQDIPLALRRKVTTVFQRPMLLERSVWDNVIYGLRLRGGNHSKDQIRASLEEVGLSHLARQRARTLSGGEAQRVALARAMVLNPDVLLLDEPTANLDPYNVGLIEGIIRRINDQHGTTLVLVTHNIFQAKRLASRTGFMLEGKVIEVAETDDFFEKPGDSRTAAFVRGEMVY